VVRVLKKQNNQVFGSVLKDICVSTFPNQYKKLEIKLKEAWVVREFQLQASSHPFHFRGNTRRKVGKKVDDSLRYEPQHWNWQA
jgi:hypothetical protein